MGHSETTTESTWEEKKDQLNEDIIVVKKSQRSMGSRRKNVIKYCEMGSAVSED